MTGYGRDRERRRRTRTVLGAGYLTALTALLGLKTGWVPAAATLLGLLALVYVVFNTIFGLRTQHAQVECFKRVGSIVEPGGVFVLADSIQTGDADDLDRMLEYFPVGFHEPYFSSYLGEDFVTLLTEAGFSLEQTELAFLTKVMRFKRL